jgi:hypothetical protein
MLLYLGIFCRKEDLVARLLIRETMLQAVPRGVTAKFILCHPSSEEMDPVMWAELRQNDDIYILDCQENMNGGKTLQFFSEISETFPNHQFYAKADTDLYLVLPVLMAALEQAPKGRFYGGRCNGAEQGIVYMSGSFYVLSRELMDLLVRCGPVCAELSDQGPEDMQTGRMLAHMVGKGLNLGDLGPGHSILYDRDPANVPINAHTVYIHPLKTPGEWWQAHRHVVACLNRTALQAIEEAQFWKGPYSYVFSGVQK